VRRALKVFALLIVVLAGSAFTRHLLHHEIRKPSVELLQQATRVKILRDSFGVPHIFGQTDADAAFGLAYAHAEDDWPTIQDVAAASTGRLSLLHLSTTAVLADYLAGLVGVREQVEEQWPGFDQRTRALLDGYANGMNLYAALHPSESDARLLPFTGKDVAAGFVYKMPLLLGLPDLLKALRAHTPRAGELVFKGGSADGSNAHALSPSRSTEGVTRLNINSHQPWEGPVAWYEAQVVSEEGWNMTGGLFPGAPVVLHGFNQKLGWAHTVNTPATVDAYELELKDGKQKLDGAWVPLSARSFTLHVDLGFATIPVPLTVHEAAQGPVFEAHGHSYALRWAGRERSALAAEEWYRMNRAGSIAELKAALSEMAIPMFNVVFASADGHIGYLYNALLPLREEPDLPPHTVLHGDRKSAIWTGYLPFEKLPHTDDPPSGFVFNTNTTPFSATSGPGNANAASYAKSDGIERDLNNRGLRSLQLFGDGDKLSRADFLERKFDRKYAADSPLMRFIAGVVDPKNPERQLVIRNLKKWNRVADEDGPALPIVVARYLETDDPLGKALDFLHGHDEVTLGEVQRLHRGKLDLPLGGGPDVLNAAMTKEQGGKLVGVQGDSLILLVDFTAQGPRAESIIQYGSSNRPDSPHYADQAKLFVNRQLKPVLRTREEIRAHLEREYAPGEELRQ
jgi:acyl-homoserine-lactone acylase